MVQDAEGHVIAKDAAMADKPCMSSGQPKLSGALAQEHVPSCETPGALAACMMSAKVGLHTDVLRMRIVSMRASIAFAD